MYLLFRCTDSIPDWPIWGKKLRLQSVSSRSGPESRGLSKFCQNVNESIQSSGPIEQQTAHYKRQKVEIAIRWLVRWRKVRANPEKGLWAIYWGVHIWVQLWTCRIQFETRLTDIKVSFIGGVLVTLEDPVYDKDDSGKVIQASFQHNDSYDNDVDKW